MDCENDPHPALLAPGRQMVYNRQVQKRRGVKTMRYKAILFDMDGTVHDTLEDLSASVNHSLDKFGLPQLSPEQIRKTRKRSPQTH